MSANINPFDESDVPGILATVPTLFTFKFLPSKFIVKLLPRSGCDSKNDLDDKTEIRFSWPEKYKPATASSLPLRNLYVT